MDSFLPHDHDQVRQVSTPLNPSHLLANHFTKAALNLQPNNFLNAILGGMTKVMGHMLHFSFRIENRGRHSTHQKANGHMMNETLLPHLAVKTVPPLEAFIFQPPFHDNSILNKGIGLEI